MTKENKPLKWKCKECSSTKKTSYKELCHNCYEKVWSKKPEAKEKMVGYVKKYVNNNKEKDLTRRKTRYNNEKTGVCSSCKQEHKKTEFHHLSYEPNMLLNKIIGGVIMKDIPLSEKEVLQNVNYHYYFGNGVSEQAIELFIRHTLANLMQKKKEAVESFLMDCSEALESDELEIVEQRAIRRFGDFT